MTEKKNLPPVKEAPSWLKALKLAGMGILALFTLFLVIGVVGVFLETGGNENPFEPEVMAPFSDRDYVETKTSVRGDEAETTVLVVNSSSDGNAYREFNYSWWVPEGGELVSLKNYDGNDVEFEVKDGLASFLLPGELRAQNKFTMTFRLQADVNHAIDPVKTTSLLVNGYEGKEASLEAEFDEEVLSVEAPRSVEVTIQGKTLKATGKGAEWIYVSFGDGGKRVGNYIVFTQRTNEEDALMEAVEKANEFSEVIPRITGFIPPHTVFPVIALPSEDYNETIDEWSAGVSLTAGAIALRDEDMVREDGSLKLSAVSTLVHETGHSYTGQFLSWNDANDSWFNEGMSNYIDTVTGKLAGEFIGEFFGDPIPYSPWTGNEYSPDGDRDALWEYYNDEGKDYIVSWEPHENKDSNERSLSYDWAELIIREKVKRDGPESMKDVYEKMWNHSTDVNTDEEFARLVGEEFMQADFTPCKSASKTEFKKCLEELASAPIELLPASKVTALGAVSFNAAFGKELSTAPLFAKAGIPPCAGFYCEMNPINANDSRCDQYGSTYTLGSGNWCFDACGSTRDYCENEFENDAGVVYCYKNKCKTCPPEQYLFEDGTCRKMF